MSTKITQQSLDNIDNIFRSLNLTKQDVEQTSQKHQIIDPSVKPQLSSQVNYNSRGQIMLSSKEIHTNYQNGIPLFKWKTIFTKIQFWFPASIILTITYGEFIKKKQTAKISLPWKFYAKTYAIIFSITSIYSFAESLLYQEFCDIDSIYYEPNQSRLSLAKKLKRSLKQADE